VNKKSNGEHRYVFAERGSASGKGFVDPYESLNNLALLIAEATRDCLFEHDGRLFILREGKLVAATLDALVTLIAERVVTQRLVNRGTADAPSYELAYAPLEVTPGQVRSLLTADSYKSGSLPARVWKA